MSYANKFLFINNLKEAKTKFITTISHSQEQNNIFIYIRETLVFYPIDLPIFLRWYISMLNHICSNFLVPCDHLWLYIIFHYHRPNFNHCTHLLVFWFFLWVPGDTRSDLDYYTDYFLFQIVLHEYKA